MGRKEKKSRARIRGKILKIGRLSGKLILLSGKHSVCRCRLKLLSTTTTPASPTNYSTVTLFARLRGLSTSCPNASDA